MLYDNAQPVDLLTLVWQETRTPLFEQRVRATIGWLDREMIAPPAADGTAGFAAAPVPASAFDFRPRPLG